MSLPNKRGLLVVEPPSEVRFPGPSTRPSRATIKLINSTTSKIAFKIKTTVPSFYGVRPNNGIVLPQSKKEVEIARQPFTQEQSTKISHKFMVQSLVIADDVEEITKIWENVDQTKLGIVKLRCIFNESLNALPIKSSPTASSSPKKQASPTKLSRESVVRKSIDRKQDLPSPKQQDGPLKISPHSSLTNKPPELPKTSSKKPLAPVGNVGSGNKIENSRKGSFEGNNMRKPTPSMESLKRMLQGNQGLDNVKKSPIVDRLDAESKQTPKQQQQQQPISQGLNYTSNISLSTTSKNLINFSPVRLPSPQRSLTKLSTYDRSPQATKQSDQRKQQRRKTGDIFTALQIATMNTEIHQLRTENKYLRNENLALKQEYQHRALKDAPSPVQPVPPLQQMPPLHEYPRIRGEYTIPHTELAHPQSTLPLCYVLASMTFAILCLILGKFVL